MLRYSPKCCQQQLSVLTGPTVQFSDVARAVLDVLKMLTIAQERHQLSVLHNVMMGIDKGNTSQSSVRQLE